MNQEHLEQRKERAGNETLVISSTDDGFRVYSAANPGTTYLVSGSPEAPACTCPDFAYHCSEPGFRCKHIFAVLNQLVPSGRAEADPVAAEERRAIQDEGRLPEKRRTPAKVNGTPQMVLKRSVSPDRRIDSLSVEFACPIDKATADEIKSQAFNTLKLQSEIVDSFLGNPTGGNGERTEAGTRNNAGDGAVPAQMLGIAGMDGRWGRRLFINVQVNGHVAKLFGNRKQLADAIAAAGFADLAANVAEGMQLNLPCRVITRPSEDGRFVNIEKVFPAAAPPQVWGNRR
jgi:predicted nucleic acid-binding Zn finger protein